MFGRTFVCDPSELFIVCEHIYDMQNVLHSSEYNVVISLFLFLFCLVELNCTKLP